MKNKNGSIYIAVSAGLALQIFASEYVCIQIIFDLDWLHTELFVALDENK